VGDEVEPRFSSAGLLSKTRNLRIARRYCASEARVIRQACGKSRPGAVSWESPFKFLQSSHCESSTHGREARLPPGSVSLTPERPRSRGVPRTTRSIHATDHINRRNSAANPTSAAGIDAIRSFASPPSVAISRFRNRERLCCLCLTWRGLSGVRKFDEVRFFADRTVGASPVLRDGRPGCAWRKALMGGALRGHVGVAAARTAVSFDDGAHAV
jgi:hypothetical protein